MLRHVPTAARGKWCGIPLPDGPVCAEGLREPVKAAADQQQAAGFGMLEERIVDGLLPSFAVLENVTGLLSMPSAVDGIREGFGELGYSVAYRTLRAEDYGVPQERRRVIFLASRCGEPPPATFCRESLTRSSPACVFPRACTGWRKQGRDLCGRSGGCWPC